MSQSGSIIEREHLGTELLPTPGSRTIAGSNGAGIARWKLHFAAGSWPIWQAGEAEEELLGYCQGGNAGDQYQIALMLMDLYRGEDRQAKIENSNSDLFSWR